MTDLEFNHQMEKLKSVYGEKNFHPSRMKIIAHELRRITNDDLETIVDAIIANCNTPPVLKDFLKYGDDIIRLRREEHHNRLLKELESRSSCKYCSNTGYELHEQTIGGHIYSFAHGCRDKSCLAAKVKIPPSYPRYDGYLSVVEEAQP